MENSSDWRKLALSGALYGFNWQGSVPGARQKTKRNAPLRARKTQSSTVNHFTISVHLSARSGRDETVPHDPMLVVSNKIMPYRNDRIWCPRRSRPMRDVVPNTPLGEIPCIAPCGCYPCGQVAMKAAVRRGREARRRRADRAGNGQDTAAKWSSAPKRRLPSFNGAGDHSPDAIQVCPHARPDTPQGIEFQSSFLALVAETAFVLAIAPDRVMHAPLPPVRRWCTSTALHTAQPAAAGPRGMEIREGGPRVAQRARLRLSAARAAVAPCNPRCCASSSSVPAKTRSRS